MATPAASEDLHRPVPAGIALEQVLCVQEQRVVGNDWCVRWRNRWVQIDKAHAPLNLPRRRVLVKQLAGGELVVVYCWQTLVVKELPARPTPPKAKRLIVNNRGWKLPGGPPWRRGVRVAGSSLAAVVLPPPVSPAPATPLCV